MRYASTETRYTWTYEHLHVAGFTQDPNFFRYTRGRFVRDEASEMARRSIHFSVDELAVVAASAVGSTACVKFEKYAEGMYNKAFLLTMDNGVQVVAKLPNPNAGRPHFTTASEVATMEYVSRPAYTSEDRKL